VAGESQTNRKANRPLAIVMIPSKKKMARQVGTMDTSIWRRP
jgi:hypothetical protein